MEALLAARSLAKSFGGVGVFEDLSFGAAQGEFLTLLGPSGCGKSTILHILSGLLVPDRGRVFLRGRDITGKTGEVSYMQQKDLLLPWRRIIDNVALPLRIQGLSRSRARREAAPLFPEFGLEGFEYAYPSQLSGGMRQRAALLRTYLFSREVLLLDEPFARLDAITKRRLHEWFLEVLERLATTVLFVTHDIDEALKLSDRIHVLSDRPARVVEEIDLRGSPRGSRSERREDPQLKDRILALLENDDGPGRSGAESNSAGSNGVESNDAESKAAGAGRISQRSS
jgi:ABC-type nitrate/sulfonate/bicarbonate transport system ATPase subunit